MGNFKKSIGLSLAVILLIGSSLTIVKAQDGPKRKMMGRGLNLPNYDDKVLHYGFFLALNYSTFRVNHSQSFADSALSGTTSGRILAINPVSIPSFTTGFILNLKLSQHFDVRILPTVAFYQRYLEFRFKTDSTVRQLQQSTFSFVELPILLKYKSKRRHNTRMYALAGIKPGLEVGAKRDEVDNSFLRVNTQDFAVEYGFGAELYYPLFKFAPEIRFSHGLANMMVKDPNPWARSMRRLTTHTVSIYFNFE